MPAASSVDDKNVLRVAKDIVEASSKVFMVLLGKRIGWEGEEGVLMASRQEHCGSELGISLVFL